MRQRLIFLFLFATTACGGGPRPLAEVGGHAITWEQVQQAVEHTAGRPPAQVAPELVAQVFVNLLEEEVLLAAAGNPAYRHLAPRERAQKARELVISLCPPPSQPTQEELQRALAQAGAQEVKERLFLRQLILASKGQALEARDRLAKGEDFAALSRELSRAPNAASGGALGWVERGQLPPEFEAALSSLDVGGVSNPVQSPAGWHVFWVEKKEKGADPTLTDQVRQRLLAEKVEQARSQCLAALGRRLEVKVYCQGAPFPCRNPFQEEP
ncbi:MAG: peptidylprolyl isomerase [Thermoanaerobaculum sp.]|nr:peptidylprolyl isomerase [Thermoanaerobaculum sp.]MDW7967067.1 peptidylprolyl isomerase [Thermoanaerobaculum sp.]